MRNPLACPWHSAILLHIRPSCASARSHSSMSSPDTISYHFHFSPPSLPQPNAPLTQLLAKHQLWMNSIITRVWLLSSVGDLQGLLPRQIPGAAQHFGPRTSGDFRSCQLFSPRSLVSSLTLQVFFNPLRNPTFSQGGRTNSLHSQNTGTSSEGNYPAFSSTL